LTGPQSDAHLIAESRTGRRARTVGRGPQNAMGQIIFSVIFLKKHSFDVFSPILGKFHPVFYIKINPTKNLFRKYNSDRNISKKFKIYEFY
jgi:hypothetical protein